MCQPEFSKRIFREISEQFITNNYLFSKLECRIFREITVAVMDRFRLVLDSDGQTPLDIDQIRQTTIKLIVSKLLLRWKVQQLLSVECGLMSQCICLTM